MFLRIVVGILALVACASQAQVPNTFEAGQPARASDVNRNFEHLSEKLGDAVSDLSIVRVEGRMSNENPAIAEAECPSGTTAVSANCRCSSEGGERNFGVLFTCTVTSVGALGACFPEGVTYDASLPLPEALLSAVCVGAERNDGTIIPHQVGGFEMRILADQHGEALARILEEMRLRAAALGR